MPKSTPIANSLLSDFWSKNQIAGDFWYSDFTKPQANLIAPMQFVIDDLFLKEITSIKVSFSSMFVLLLCVDCSILHELKAAISAQFTNKKEI